MWYCNVLYPNSKSSSHFSKNIIKLRKGKMKDGDAIAMCPKIATIESVLFFIEGPMWHLRWITAG